MYRDEMSLRELRVRLAALPYDSPLHAALEQAQKDAEEAVAAAALTDVMHRYR